MIGSAANAACVKSGVDPVICGNPPGPMKPLDSMQIEGADARPINLPQVGGQRCTAQGLCVRAGMGAQNGCLASCFICTPSTIHPDFLLISVLYAPPGNASTASFGQSTSSGVTYGIGSNISESSGTSVAITESFSAPPSGSGSGSGGGGDSGGFSINLQSSSASGSGETNQFSVVTTSTSTDNLKPGKDVIDHTQDIFLLWLNPVVTLTKSDQATLAAAITAGDVQMSVQSVSANQLMNGIPAEKLAPTQICPTPSTCYTLPGLGSLTKDDINMILAQDPFLSSSSGQTPDPSRFIYIQSNPLENTSVAASTTQTFTVSDAQTNSQTTTQSTSSTDGVTTGLSIKGSVIGISLSQSDSWTWTQTVSRGSSNGQTQQASVTLSSTTQSCCGINNTVTCEVSIWEDMIYRTFAFVPQPESCQGVQSPSPAPLLVGAVGPSPAKHVEHPALSIVGPPLRGTVLRNNAPLRGATVIITDGTGQILYRVVTDHSGHYFSGAIAPGSVRVRVGSKTLQTVIRSATSVVLDVVM